jgi:hypothetical protein
MRVKTASAAKANMKRVEIVNSVAGLEESSLFSTLTFREVMDEDEEVVCDGCASIPDCVSFVTAAMGGGMSVAGADSVDILGLKLRLEEAQVERRRFARTILYPTVVVGGARDTEYTSKL